jgi:tRNA threonylcarbamoyladenosine dehydratase
MTERFVRIEQLIGSSAVKKLARARVAVFGLGAVGSFAIEALARSGVGEFVLVDFDQVRYSNFNRQLLALESGLGRLKTELALKRVGEINPECRVSAHSVFADTKTIPLLLKPVPDLVIDAIDSMGPKTELAAFCIRHGITVLSSMGAGARVDPFSIRIGDISEARNCPLARRLRKELKRKHGIDKALRCVYSVEKPRAPAASPKKEAEYYQRGRSRSPVGTLSYLTGMFGLMVAFEALGMLLGEQLGMNT